MPGHSCTVVGKKMYLFGGNTVHQTMADYWTLEIDQDEQGSLVCIWEELKMTNTPSPRVGHTATAIGDRIFVVGGRDFLSRKFSCTAHMFDTRNPKPQFFDDSRSILFFVPFPGCTDGFFAGCYRTLCWDHIDFAQSVAVTTSPESGRYRFLERTGHAAVATPNGILIFGGLGKERQDTPPGAKWLCDAAFIEVF